jgi:hypothetical protein
MMEKKLADSFYIQIFNQGTATIRHNKWLAIVAYFATWHSLLRFNQLQTIDSPFELSGFSLDSFSFFLDFPPVWKMLVVFFAVWIVQILAQSILILKTASYISGEKVKLIHLLKQSSSKIAQICMVDLICYWPIFALCTVVIVSSIWMHLTQQNIMSEIIHMLIMPLFVNAFTLLLIPGLMILVGIAQREILLYEQPFWDALKQSLGIIFRNIVPISASALVLVIMFLPIIYGTSALLFLLSVSFNIVDWLLRAVGNEVGNSLYMSFWRTTNIVEELAIALILGLMVAYRSSVVTALYLRLTQTSELPSQSLP